MKKILMTAFAVGLMSFGASAQGDMLTGGTFINAGLFIPNGSYGSASSINKIAINYDSDNATDYGMGASLQFGQAFTFAELSTVGLGMRVTWIELAGATWDTGVDTTTGYVFHASLFKVGPQVSFAIGDEIAADLYYQFAPTVVVKGEFGNEDGTDMLGFTNSMGFNFRIKRISLGAEYAFGNIRNNDTRKGGDFEILGPVLQRTTNLKFSLGLQFNK